VGVSANRPIRDLVFDIFEHAPILVEISAGGAGRFA
jgi:hypothetical protein